MSSIIFFLVLYMRKNQIFAFLFFRIISIISFISVDKLRADVDIAVTHTHTKLRISNIDLSV